MPQPTEVKKITTIDVPVQVDLDDLGDTENWRLFQQEELGLLKKLLSELPPGRYSKERIGELMAESNPAWPKRKAASYGVIKEEDGSLYAVYKGSLGAGAFGEVKLVQNTITGKWSALKVQMDENGSGTKIIEREHKTLLAIGASRGNIIKREREREINFIMDYGRGVDLARYLVEEPQLSAIRWLEIALQATQKVQELHDKGYLHRDIKPANILYDAYTNQVTIIDYGLTLEMNSGYATAKSAGTPNYMPPEILNHPGILEYTTAVDVYSLGKTLEKIFGFSKVWDAENQTYISNNTPFTGDHELKNLLKAMTSPNPKKRPTLAEVILKLQSLRQELLPLSQKTVGIVEVSEYYDKDTTDADLEMFIAPLRSVDEVILVDNRERGDAKFYSQLKRYLEEAGIIVRSEVLISDNLQSVTSDIYNLAEKKNDEVTLSQPCYFYSGEKQNLPENILSIKVTKEKRNYRKEVREKSSLITEAQLTVVQNTLQNEIDRLTKKYGGPHRNAPQDQAIARRITLLKNALQSIEQAYNKKELTHYALFNKLNMLEKDILATSKISTLAFGLYKPKTARELRKTKNILVKEASQEIPKMKKM